MRKNFEKSDFLGAGKKKILKARIELATSRVLHVNLAPLALCNVERVRWSATEIHTV